MKNLKIKPEEYEEMTAEGTDAVRISEILAEIKTRAENDVETFTFAEAVKYLKDGLAVYRVSWNGKGQYIKAQFPDERSKMTLPYVYIKTAQEDLVPWVASQTDIMATDWTEFLGPHV